MLRSLVLNSYLDKTYFQTKMKIFEPVYEMIKAFVINQRIKPRHRAREDLEKKSP